MKMWRSRPPLADREFVVALQSTDGTLRVVPTRARDANEARNTIERLLQKSGRAAVEHIVAVKESRA